MRTTLSLVIAIALAACGDDAGGDGGGGDGGNGSDSGGGGGNFVDGMIVLVGGGTAPSDAKTVVVWVSDIGQGDFIYKWGEGTATATTFTANVMTPVPNDATFGGLLGVGVVALVPSSANIPDGVVEDGVFTTTALGFTGEYSIIYRPNTDPTPEPSWDEDFPVGLSCGKCVPQAQGFDTFEPVPCSEVKLQVGPMSAIQGCNWT